MSEVLVQVNPNVAVVTETVNTNLTVSVDSQTQDQTVLLTVDDQGLTVVVQPQITNVSVVVEPVSAQQVTVQPEITTETINVTINESTSETPSVDPDLTANKTFTYISGLLTQILFTTGNRKVFTYDLQDRLSQVDYIKTTGTTRSSFSYNNDGSVSGVTVSLLP